MKSFLAHTGIMAPLRRNNVDTDQIIPKQFLKRIERTGFGQFFFYDWRYDEDGRPRPDFVLNQTPYAQASILLAGENFGCGSSREHAPWALLDFGIRVIVAPSFADIFYNNCLQNGILPVALDSDLVNQLFNQAAQHSPLTLTVDLSQGVLTCDETSFSTAFSIDPGRRDKLMKGLDPIDETFLYQDAIRRYEVEHQPSPVR